MTPPSAAELKGCPFCGAKPSIETEKRRHAVMCLNPDCGEVMTRWWRTNVEAIAAWNTRAIASQAPPAGEDVRQVISEQLSKCLVERDIERFKTIAFVHRHEILAALSPPIQEAVAGEREPAPDEDWLADVIDDSLDMDWTGRVGARAIIAAWGKRP